MITIIKTKDNVANAGLQYAEIEVTADGDTCRMVISTPTLSGAELQTYCDEREGEYKLAVLKAMYPDAILRRMRLSRIGLWQGTPTQS